MTPLTPWSTSLDAAVLCLADLGVDMDDQIIRETCRFGMEPPEYRFSTKAELDEIEVWCTGYLDNPKFVWCVGVIPAVNLIHACDLLDSQIDAFDVGGESSLNYVWGRPFLGDYPLFDSREGAAYHANTY